WTGYDFPLNTLNDLQALTATDAWAVGSRFVGPGPEVVPTMAHFDGSTWTAVTPPPIPASISSTFLRVAPVGPNDVWALARRDLAHWNGTDWTVIPLPREFTAGRDLAVDGNGDPWVTPFTGARVPYRYSGGTWHPATIPSGKVMSYITAVPGTSTIWGVAHSGGYVDPWCSRTANAPHTRSSGGLPGGGEHAVPEERINVVGGLLAVTTGAEVAASPASGLVVGPAASWRGVHADRHANVVTGAEREDPEQWWTGGELAGLVELHAAVALGLDGDGEQVEVADHGRSPQPGPPSQSADVQRAQRAHVILPSSLSGRTPQSWTSC